MDTVFVWASLGGRVRLFQIQYNIEIAVPWTDSVKTRTALFNVLENGMILSVKHYVKFVMCGFCVTFKHHHLLLFSICLSEDQH